LQQLAHGKACSGRYGGHKKQEGYSDMVRKHVWSLTVISVALAAGGLAPLALSGQQGETVVGDILPHPVAKSPPSSQRDAGDVPPLEVLVSRAPAGAPNVVLVMFDDVGYGAAGTFGGPIPTPALDRLADQGLRYNRFHNTAICSPTRAALLTGRNPHAVGWGRTAEVPSAHPGYNHRIPGSATTIAEILRQHGYSTSMWGKWHLTPLWETSPIGPFDRWPSGLGFEKFYGFLGGEAHHFEPNLYDGTITVQRPGGEDYFLTEDLADQAIGWMRLQNSIAPERPFFSYFATGANHAPLHAPQAWIDRFKGQFDHGWDVQRERTFARQLELGVIPEGTELTPRPDLLPAWDDLTPERRQIAARMMEVYAAMLAHTDAQVGRMIDALDEMDELDNTLFIYIVGDNGGSGEGGPLGTLNEMGLLQGITEDDEMGMKRLDDIGGPDTYPQYPAGWAWATNAPFQWTKQVASHFGGTRTPVVISWPDGISDRGGLREHFSHVNSIMPTILDAVGIPAPSVVHGVEQQPMDGTSLLYTFDDADAEERHRTQYFEIMGNRAIYHDGWMASAKRGRAPWDVARAYDVPYSEDVWELYHVDKDYSQAFDLAEQHPEKLKELQELFWAEAEKNQVLPMHGYNSGLTVNPPERTRFVYYPGATGIPESLAPATVGRSHSISAELQVPEAGSSGVLAAQGGSIAGYALYVDKQGRLAYTYNLFGVERPTIVATDPLPSGHVTVRLEHAYEGEGFGGSAGIRLFVNDQEVASGRLNRTTPVFFSIDETFDVGTDTGSPVGRYPANFHYSGELLRLTVDLE